jgi:hypothetical protein
VSGRGGRRRGAAAAAATSSAARPTIDLTAATSAASGSSTTLGKAAGAGRLAKLARLARRAVHGDLLVKTKNGYQTVTFDRGKVTAASATSVSVQRPDGVSVTEKLTSSTKYLGISSSSAIVSGKGAILISRNGTALAVAQRPVSAGTSSSSGATAPNSVTG